MAKNYSSPKIIFITISLSMFMVVLGISQTPKNNTGTNKTSTPANSKTTIATKTQTPTVKKTTPVNTKNIKARGVIAADMDCTVKISTVAKPVTVFAYTGKVVILGYGLNTIEATTTDKEKPSSFKTTINVTDTSRQIIEISFYDDSRFLDYIKQGRVTMVENALKKNPDLAKNEDQSLPASPLQTAIINSQPAIAKMLFEKGASYLQPENIFPLHKAAIYASSVKEKGMNVAPDREMIDYFVSKGCKLTDTDDNGNTLLHSSTRAMKLDLVKYLVEQGLDVNAKNNSGDTPLKIAEDKGAVSIIEFLETKGALDK